MERYVAYFTDVDGQNKSIGIWADSERDVRDRFAERYPLRYTDEENKTGLVGAILTRIATGCQTPGAIYRTEIEGNRVQISVTLPNQLDLTDMEARMLDDNLHNAMELVLAPIVS